MRVQQKQRLFALSVRFLLAVTTFYSVQSNCKGEIIYGVIDRVIDDQVVFLLTDDTELLLPKNKLLHEPSPGVWFRIERDHQTICSLAPDFIKTKLHQQQMNTLYEQMKSSPFLQRVKNRDEK